MSNEKEFVSVYVSDQLSDNYSRILKDTTLATQVNYHKRFKGWQLNSLDDIEGYIDNIVRRWQSGEYMHQTIRQYKAVLGYALSNAYQFKINPKKMNYKYREYYDIASNASLEQLESVYDRVIEIGKDDDIPTLDRQASYNAQTSSTKDKRFSPLLVSRILSLQPNLEKKGVVSMKLLQDFIYINTKIGLRPIEYENATLIRHDIAHNKHLLTKLGFSNTTQVNALGLITSPNDTTKPLLLVKNAKNSHSRACGQYRLLYLDVLSHDDIERLQSMMLKMREIDESSQKTFSLSVIKPLASKLYYILTSDNDSKKIIKRLHDEKLRSYRKQSKKQARQLPNFKRPTLYSTRHQAVANAKASKLHPALIAACFGHSSVHTASAHYGKSVFGSGGGLMPAQVSANEVIANLTSSQLLIENKSIKEGMAEVNKKSANKIPSNAPRL